MSSAMRLQDQLVKVAVQQRQRETGHYPSVEVIAQDSRLSTRQVRRSLTRLGLGRRIR